jgi:prophage regulatory protein
MNSVDRVLRLPELMNRLGLGRSAIYRALREGSFPRPIKITPRASGWLQSEVDAWLAARITQREESTAIPAKRDAK